MAARDVKCKKEIVSVTVTEHEKMCSFPGQ